MRLNFYVALLCSFIACEVASAQEVFSPYYVVIGGFKIEENAQKYCDFAHEQNLPAVYAFNEERQIYYVYVRATQTKEVADDILARMKSTTVFRDAWVFNGVLSGSDLATKRQPAPPVKQEVKEPEVVVEKPVEKVPEEPRPGATPPPVQVAAESPKPVGKPFVFRVVNGETGNVLKGLVRLQESEKALQFRGFNSNETVYVPAPANRSGKWILVCQVMGFRQLKKPVVYEKAQELDGVSIGSSQEIIIPLELQRVKKGDYIEMENVKFYHDAALFSPGSERELDELLAMMEENPDYQIRLHGHTNGNQPRDIVSIGTSTDFFSPNVSNAKTHGTAKELSLLRAELVKSYLVSKGIDPNRVTTKAEGGTQMIFDPSGTLAGMNDRVEVEIRKH
jgi:outer membrane protein OmpA-like peptidoglycan-associated protein